jgi:hypothetical protein
LPRRRKFALRSREVSNSCVLHSTPYFLFGKINPLNEVGHMNHVGTVLSFWRIRCENVVSSNTIPVRSHSRNDARWYGPLRNASTILRQLSVEFKLGCLALRRWIGPGREWPCRRFGFHSDEAFGFLLKAPTRVFWRAAWIVSA